MSDSDDVVLAFVLLMDYFIRKLRSSFRIPKQVLIFSGRDQMMELLCGHEGCFVQVLRMKKECFFNLCGLISKNNGLQETRLISLQEQAMIFLTMVS